MFFKPANSILREYFHSIWIIDTASIPRDTLMLPDGYSDVMLNLGGPYSVSFNGGDYREVRGSVFFGQRTQSLRLDQPGEVDMIGIRLIPGREYIFTGVPAVEFTDRFVSLRQLFGDLVTRYEQILRHQRSPGEKARFTEELLLQLVQSPSGYENELMHRATGLIFKNRGVYSMAELLEATGFKYKQCERYFKKHLGITPKMYLRIIRFYHAFTQVRGKTEVDWTQLLREYNYFDQSHFIKDYKLFTGLSPGKQFAKKDTIDEFFGFK